MDFRQWQEFLGAGGQGFCVEECPRAISDVVKAVQNEVCGFHRRKLGDDYRFIYLGDFPPEADPPLAEWSKMTSAAKAPRVLLVAYGVTHDGTGGLIDFMLASSSDACWWDFLSDLKARGLRGQSLEVIVHRGCGAVLRALAGLYPRVKTQLCVFHNLSNISQKLSDRRHRSQILKEAGAIYQAETDEELRENLDYFKSKWQHREARAVESFIKGFEATLTYREYTEPLRSAIKTSNPLKRHLEQLQRRTKSAEKFLKAGSVDRIVYTLVAYVLDAHIQGKKTAILQNLLEVDES